MAEKPAPVLYLLPLSTIGMPRNCLSVLLIQEVSDRSPATLGKGQALYKKFPAKAGRVRGIVCARDVLVQSGPANELYRAPPQVKILGQYGLYVLGLSGLIHCFAELNDAAKLVAVAILRVGQDKLRVVLSGHGFRLRPAA